MQLLCWKICLLHLAFLNLRMASLRLFYLAKWKARFVNFSAVSLILIFPAMLDFTVILNVSRLSCSCFAAVCGMCRSKTWLVNAQKPSAGRYWRLVCLRNSGSRSCSSITRCVRSTSAGGRCCYNVWTSQFSHSSGQIVPRCLSIHTTCMLTWYSYTNYYCCYCFLFSFYWSGFPELL